MIPEMIPELATPSELRALVPPSVLGLWTIYKQPSDYPDKYVLRPHFIASAGRHFVTAQCWTADSLEMIRDLLPPGLYNLGRQPDDDPVIIETWI